MLEAGLAAFKLGGAIGSLFKKKKKAPTPRDNIMSQAQGARDASAKYGFNPLTMLQYGQPAGAMGVADGGAPPLASIDLISGALHDVNDIVSGDAARRRAADQLELDLAKVKIDQAKSQIALDNARLGQMLSEATFGRRAATASNGQNARIAQPPFAGPYLGREVDVEKVPSTSGVAILDTPVAGDRPYVLPATGADGLDELGAAAAAVAYQKQQDWRESMATRARLSMSGTPEQKAQAREEYTRDMFRHPPGMTGLWTRAMGLWDFDVRKDLKKRKVK